MNKSQYQEFADGGPCVCDVFKYPLSVIKQRKSLISLRRYVDDQKLLLVGEMTHVNNVLQSNKHLSAVPPNIWYNLHDPVGNYF